MTFYTDEAPAWDKPASESAHDQERDELAAYDRLTQLVCGLDERCREETGLGFDGE